MLPRRHRLGRGCHGGAQALGRPVAGAVDVGADPFEELDRRESLLAPGWREEHVEGTRVDAERSTTGGNRGAHALRVHVPSPGRRELGRGQSRRIPTERRRGRLETAGGRAEPSGLEPELVTEATGGRAVPRDLDPSECLSRVSQQVGVARQGIAQCRYAIRIPRHQTLDGKAVRQVREGAHGGLVIAAT